MKLLISLSDEDNLVTLKSIAPNFDFQYYAGNPIMHPSMFRRINKDMRPKKSRLEKFKKRRKLRRATYDSQPTAMLHPTYVTENERRDTLGYNSNSSTNTRNVDLLDLVLRAPEFAQFAADRSRIHIVPHGDLCAYIRMDFNGKPPKEITHRFVEESLVAYLNSFDMGVSRASITSGSPEGGTIGIYFKE